MSIEFILYLIDMLGNVSGLITGILIASSLLLFILCFFSIDEYTEFKNTLGAKALAIFFKYSWLYILLALTTAFIPSQKTMYLMLGANYLKNSTLPSKVEIAISKKIDEYLVEEKK